MTTSTWISTACGNWATAADWSGSTAPGAGSTVVIATTGAQTVTVNSHDGTIAAFATLSAVDTLLFAAGGFL